MTARYRIGEWEIDASTRTLNRHDESETLSPRAMDVLMHLAAHPGEVIPGSALIEAYWPRAVTSPNAIQKIVTELRHALRDGHDGATYIETVPKRGYRLIAAVSSIEANGAEQSREAIVFSIGTRTALIKPISAVGSTLRGKTFAQLIRSELVTQLNQLTNASARPMPQPPTTQSISTCRMLIHRCMQRSQSLPPRVNGRLTRNASIRQPSCTRESRTSSTRWQSCSTLTRWSACADGARATWMRTATPSKERCCYAASPSTRCDKPKRY